MQHPFTRFVLIGSSALCLVGCPEGTPPVDNPDSTDVGDHEAPPEDQPSQDDDVNDDSDDELPADGDDADRIGEPDGE